MKHGFVKVATATPIIKVADCDYNTKQIIHLIKSAKDQEIKILGLPQLCITGYTCSDLFLQDTLLNGAKESLKKIVDSTIGMDVLTVLGLPLLNKGKIYNVAAVIQNGNILGFVPKVNIPNYCESYESRYFAKGPKVVEYVEFDDKFISFGSRILFICQEIKDLVVGVEVCEDLWVVQPPSSEHAIAGATVIVNTSASSELTGKDVYRKELVKSHSARLNVAYMYADAGEGESTTDLVFSAHNMIAENGVVLAEANRFLNEMIVTEIDLGRLLSERRRMTTFERIENEYRTIHYSMPNVMKILEKNELPEIHLTRLIDSMPFVPKEKEERKKRCKEITMIQAMGLKKRLQHINCENVVIGISGGLDSTLTLLIAKKVFALLGLDSKKIIAVTMPCFGTTKRTYQNALTLIHELEVSFKEINISESVRKHFVDISHDEAVHNVIYENAQARERTQVLMDLANKHNAIVIGTGDMSELALGFATYNGDHMSMYGVNASIPKTLIRYLVSYFADETENISLREVLLDILDTPVSPELFPPEKGVISQVTEDIVGPYELHDFYLYYMMRFGYSPAKIYRLAFYAFSGQYTKETILKWLKLFYHRFFLQQYKRSCLPDGPKVGSVAISPRGDLRMPSDACVTLWRKELDNLI